MASDYEELTAKLRDEQQTADCRLQTVGTPTAYSLQPIACPSRRKVARYVVAYEGSADAEARGLVDEMQDLGPDDEALWTWLFGFAEEGEGGTSDCRL